MRCPLRPHLPALLLLLASLPACSNLAVKDVYSTKGKALDYRSSRVWSGAWIDSISVFNSLGPVGVPILPLHISSSKSEKISLKVDLNAFKDVDFSFATNPCFEIDQAEKLCPKDVEVSVVASWQDNKLPEFSKQDNLHINPIAKPNSRITRQNIYNYYRYSGRPWNNLSVHVTYTFECNGQCAANLRLDANLLVHAESVFAFPQVVDFVRSRETNYEALSHP